MSNPVPLEFGVQHAVYFRLCAQAALAEPCLLSRNPALSGLTSAASELRCTVRVLFSLSHLVEYYVGTH